VTEIELTNSRWKFDVRKPLGAPGGFGAVFRGLGPDGKQVAVKRLHVSVHDAAGRELQIAEDLCQRTLQSVVPVLDAGLDKASAHYFVVMELADRSLQDQIDASGPVSQQESIEVLLDIALGLKEVGDLVHRDLKPGNVLHHGGRWKLADFGIARFVERATATNTLKDCMSPHYAAPEQWNHQRATNATDVYALGCIAHALITGQPPFNAGNFAAMRDQHLHQEPKGLPVSPLLGQLVFACLAKTPASRPPIDSVISQLEGLRGATAPTSPLAQAALAVAERTAAEEAKSRSAADAAASRGSVAKDGLRQLDRIIELLFQEIASEAPNAQVLSRMRSVSLGSGKLQLKVAFPSIEPGVFAHSNWDVVAGATITVEQDNTSYPRRSCNLWYADPTRSGSYQWWEFGLWQNGLYRHRVQEFEPFSVSHRSDLEKADLAASNVLCPWGVTPRPPVRIDGEHQEAFRNRWKTHLAKAATNTMPRPTGMPEHYK